MLLTSSQVSALISGGIICAFTLVLFLCGYVLQQQTLHNLQSVIKPNFPQPALQGQSVQFDPKNEANYARGSKEYQSYRSTGLKKPSVEADWGKLAYVQFVQQHSDVCASVILFAELSKLRSPAKRILLFPQAWAEKSTHKKEDENFDKELATSLRLLKWAARRYHVNLRPLDAALEKSKDGTPTSQFPLTAMFQLTEMERILFMPQPGLLMDALSLDVLLGYYPAKDLIALPTTGQSSASNMSSSLLLLNPSQAEFSRLSKLQSEKELPDDEALLHEAFPGHASPNADDDEALSRILLSDIASLRSAPEGFDGENFLQEATYIQMKDPLLPGPEFDAPRKVLEQVWPKDVDPKYTYKRLVDRFRQRRMDICGLGLERWPDEDDE